jgi:hypothetical protein
MRRLLLLALVGCSYDFDRFLPTAADAQVDEASAGCPEPAARCGATARQCTDGCASNRTSCELRCTTGGCRSRCRSEEQICRLRCQVECAGCLDGAACDVQTICSSASTDR